MRCRMRCAPELDALTARLSCIGASLTEALAKDQIKDSMQPADVAHGRMRLSSTLPRNATHDYGRHRTTNLFAVRCRHRRGVGQRTPNRSGGNLLAFLKKAVKPDAGGANAASASTPAAAEVGVQGTRLLAPPGAPRPIKGSE